MDLNGAFQAGLVGVQQGQRLINQAAQTIAEQGTVAEYDSNSTTEAVVQQLQGQRQVEASTEVLKTASDTLGRVIDVIA